MADSSQKINETQVSVNHCYVFNVSTSFMNKRYNNYNNTVKKIRT